MEEDGHWQFFTRFEDKESGIFPQAGQFIYMLVDRKPNKLPQAALVAKVHGTTDIPGVMAKFMPQFGTYQFTDMELLKDWKSPFTIIASQEDFELISDPTFQAWWKKDQDKPEVKSEVFTEEEQKVLIKG